MRATQPPNVLLGYHRAYSGTKKTSLDRLPWFVDDVIGAVALVHLVGRCRRIWVCQSAGPEFTKKNYLELSYDDCMIVDRGKLTT